MESKMLQSPGPGFSIKQGRGFHITFENGYTASVQFGPGSYCGDSPIPRDFLDFEASKKTDLWESKNAEIACWGPDREFVHLDDGAHVSGYQSPRDVLIFLNWVANGCQGDYPLRETLAVEKNESVMEDLILD
jgi:hypothetical protein